MDLATIIKSTQHLEFVNELDNLIHNLLYSKERGYINLTSKSAQENLEKYVSFFENEAQRIKRESNLQNKDEIINLKKQDYLEKIKTHFEKESLNRAFEVYKNRIDNCLFQASINKENKKKLDEIYTNGLCAISWIAEIKELDEKEKIALIENFNTDFNYSLKSTDEELLKDNTVKVSSPKRFLKLYEMISKENEKFIDYNLELEAEFLNAKDINYLKQKQNDLKTFRKTSVIDETSLVNYTLKMAGLKTDEEKYRFIKELEDDFSLFYSTNKKIDEQDKLEIIKRRINLFNSKDKEEYFKNKLFN